MMANRGSGVLDLDIGNTFLKWRYNGDCGQLSTAELQRRQFLQLCSAPGPARVRLASVACQQQEADVADWCQAAWGLSVEIARSSAATAGVVNSYADPARMGVDRWLAMIAAYQQLGCACCVVDCGSAITIDYVADDGRHLGGYIMPGLRLMRTGLLSNTRRVLVESNVAGWKNCAPGNNTEDAVDHGICLLLDALAQRFVSEVRSVLGDHAKLVITGGDGASFRASAGEGLLQPELVLDGLAIALP